MLIRLFPILLLIYPSLVLGIDLRRDPTPGPLMCLETGVPTSECVGVDRTQAACMKLGRPKSECVGLTEPQVLCMSGGWYRDYCAGVNWLQAECIASGFRRELCIDVTPGVLACMRTGRPKSDCEPFALSEGVDITTEAIVTDPISPEPITGGEPITGPVD